MAFADNDTEFVEYPGIESHMTMVANTWIRQMHFPNAGNYMAGHKHTFNHTTLLAKGKFRVKVNGHITDYTAPQVVIIKAGLEHKIVALEDDSLAYCIHALHHGEKEEDIYDPDQVPLGVDMSKEATPFLQDMDNKGIIREA